MPAALRDTLLRAAVQDLYQAVWSDEILIEVERVLVRESLTTPAGARYLIDTIRANFPAALPSTRYRDLISTMPVNEKDRHVLAVAVYASARLIITENIRDFPADALSAYRVEAWSPDQFLSQLFEYDPLEMSQIVIRQAEALRYGGITISDVLSNLQLQAPSFAAMVRERLAID